MLWYECNNDVKVGVVFFFCSFPFIFLSSSDCTNFTVISERIFGTWGSVKRTTIALSSKINKLLT